MAVIDEKVKQIVIEQLGVEEGEVTPSASFVDDLGADSLDRVELVMAFEEAFNLEIPDEDAEKISTIKEAVEYIDKHTYTHTCMDLCVFFLLTCPFFFPLLSSE